MSLFFVRCYDAGCHAVAVRGVPHLAGRYEDIARRVRVVGDHEPVTIRMTGQPSVNDLLLELSHVRPIVNAVGDSGQRKHEGQHQSPSLPGLPPETG